MIQTLRAEAFNVTAVEGQIQLNAPGLIATLNVDVASFLSDQLLAACEAAQLQQRKIHHDDDPIEWV